MLKSLYHRIVPPRLRLPFGIARRRLHDLLVRQTASDPIPPGEFILRHEGSGWAAAHLRAGKSAAESVIAALELGGLSPHRSARVLEIHCGPAGLLRHLRDTRWTLHGCDEDAEALAWASEAFPLLRLSRCTDAPPVPYSSGWFEAVIVISLLPRIEIPDAEVWAIELARLLRGDGLLVLGVHGLTHSAAGPGETPDWARRAQEVSRLFSPFFELTRWQTNGLGDGRDLAVLRRR